MPAVSIGSRSALIWKSWSQRVQMPSCQWCACLGKNQRSTVPCTSPSEEVWHLSSCACYEIIMGVLVQHLESCLSLTFASRHPSRISFGKSHWHFIDSIWSFFTRILQCMWLFGYFHEDSAKVSFSHYGWAHGSERNPWVWIFTCYWEESKCNWFLAYFYLLSPSSSMYLCTAFIQEKEKERSDWAWFILHSLATRQLPCQGFWVM